MKAIFAYFELISVEKSTEFGGRDLNMVKCVKYAIIWEQNVL